MHSHGNATLFYLFPDGRGAMAKELPGNEVHLGVGHGLGNKACVVLQGKAVIMLCAGSGE